MLLDIALGKHQNTLYCVLALLIASAVLKYFCSPASRKFGTPDQQGGRKWSRAVFADRDGTL